MWVWLPITSLMSKGTLIRSTLIISRVRFDSLGTTALKGPTVAGLNQNEYRALNGETHMLAVKLAPLPLCPHYTLTSLGSISASVLRSWTVITVSSFYTFSLNTAWPGPILHHAFMWSSVISLLALNDVCYTLGEASVYFYPILPCLIRIGNIQRTNSVHTNNDSKFDVNI